MYLSPLFFGEPRLVVLGMLIAGLALGAVPYLPTVALMVGVLSLLALFTALTSPSLSSLTSRVVDPDEVGGVLGIYQGLGSLARIAGPFVGVVAFKDLGTAWPFRIGALVTLAAGALAVLLATRLRGREISPT